MLVEFQRVVPLHYIIVIQIIWCFLKSMNYLSQCWWVLWSGYFALQNSCRAQKYFNSFFFAQIGLLLKMANSRPLFYIFVHSTVNSKLKFLIKILRWLHLNCGPEVFEATTLPSKSKPLPQIGLHSNRHRQIHSRWA